MGLAQYSGILLYTRFGFGVIGSQTVFQIGYGLLEQLLRFPVAVLAGIERGERNLIPRHIGMIWTQHLLPDGQGPNEQ